MRTRSKGFTLIELLAVIVVLAIIALIATPMILNVVEKARKGAAKSSALGYIDAVEKQIMVNQLNENPEINDGEYSLPMDNKYKISIKGSKPSSGNMAITKSKVASATMCINNYTVTYNGKTATVGNKCNGSSSSEPQSTFGGTKVSAQPGDTHKGIVYLDPTDLSKECNASNSVSTTETKTGCMKWYIFNDSGDNYTMILDHNTTATVAWNSNGSNASMGEVATALSTDTTGWTSGLNPRLITANEIASITNTTTFDGTYNTWFYLNGSGDKKQTQVSTSQGTNEYAWLFDYTNGCESYGCNTADSSNYGYWTSSPVSDYSDGAWIVGRCGDLTGSNVDNDSDYGVRPVITIDKSIIKN